ncbi:MAG: cupin domain-containing protein [Patescibacteria group bacterium]
MIGFVKNIEQLTLANEYFRQVLYTGQHAQVVVMSLKPKEDIGLEVHEIVDQFLRIESGEGKVIIDGEEHVVKDGSAIVVPAGTKHNLVNTSADQPMKLYTVYSPPHHKDGTIHKTKKDAEADSADHL